MTAQSTNIENIIDDMVSNLFEEYQYTKMMLNIVTVESD